MRFFSLISAVAPVVFAANCSVDERAIWASNQKFGDDFTQCSKTAWGSKSGTASCVSRLYPNLSVPCSECFGDAAACGLNKCMFQCARDAGSANCLTCIDVNCSSALLNCTGGSKGGLPLPPKSTTEPAKAAVITTKKPVLVTTTKAAKSVASTTKAVTTTTKAHATTTKASASTTKASASTTTTAASTAGKSSSTAKPDDATTSKKTTVAPFSSKAPKDSATTTTSEPTQAGTVAPTKTPEVTKKPATPKDIPTVSTTTKSGVSMTVCFIALIALIM